MTCPDCRGPVILNRRDLIWSCIRCPWYATDHEAIYVGFVSNRIRLRRSGDISRTYSEPYRVAD